MYDPQTGVRLEKPLPLFDPFTGQPIQRPAPKYDMYTGRPLFQPAPRFDPQTGRPLDQPTPRFDIHTGQPLNPPPAPTQHSGYIPPAAPAPQQTSAPTGNEFFVGINILSKIGVIFIIIGVIAFSAVSESYLSPMVRTLIIFALGLLMAGLGEVFYRMGSKIFARALTIGGIGELAISTLIGYGSFESLTEYAALIVGAAAAAGGILLALRYNSQTIMTVAAVSGFLPCFATFSEMIPQISGMFYILLFQTAVIILCHRKEWNICQFVSIGANSIISIAVYISTSELAPDIATIVAPAFVALSFGLYMAGAFVRTMRDEPAYPAGDIQTVHTAIFYYSIISATVLNFIYMAANDALMGFGFISLFYAVICTILAVAAKRMYDADNFMKILLNAAITLICLSIFTIFDGDYVYFIFHVCAAALLVFAFYKNINFVKVWGYITCSFAEFFFLCICIKNIGKLLYALQFSANAIIWIAVMVLLALRGVRGTGFSAFTIITSVNTAIMGCYLITHLTNHLQETDVIIADRVSYVIVTLGAAMVWMAVAFAVGKFRFIGKAAPITSIILYSFGLIEIFNVNAVSSIGDLSNEMICVIFSIAVNLISVAAALDMALNISELAPKFARAIGLVVTIYAMFSVTAVLGANKILAFTSCIISIFYLVVAVVWIIWGFLKDFPLMRRFGLALTLLASGKLFLFDFAGIDDMARTGMFILFGIILLVVSFIYAVFERKLKKQAEEERNNIR